MASEMKMQSTLSSASALICLEYTDFVGTMFARMAKRTNCVVVLSDGHHDWASNWLRCFLYCCI